MGALADFDAIRFKIEGGIDQGYMAKGLWEISDHAVVLKVKFFAEQSHVITQGKQLFKELFCIPLSANGLESRDHPEAASEKDAFAWRQAILDLRSVVAQNKTMRHQLAFNGCYRAFHTRIVTG